MIIKPTTSGGRRIIAARLGGRARVWLTLLLVCAMTVSTVALAGEAAAATPTFGVEVGYDGTGWDAGGNPTASTCRITGAGGDNSAHDGVVCTNDDIGYNWTYSIPANTAVTATFVQTLPAGARWNASDVQQCQGGSSFSYTGTGSISANGLTLTCTITWPSSANSVAGSIPVSAHVLATFPNGTPLHTVLSVDGAPSSPPDVTVRSQSQVDLRKTALIISSGGNNYYDILVGIAGINTLNTDNPKGIAALTSPITLTDVLQPAGVTGSPASTTLQSCYNPPYTSDPQVAPGAAGSWTCSQPGGPGTPIQIAITGANTSGEGSPAIAGGTTVLAGAILVRIPRSAITTAVQFYDQLTNFDPTDVNGQSNYGTGFEPGGAPGDTCLNPAKNNNCAVTAIGVTYHSVLEKHITSRVPPLLPEASPGVPVVTPNQPFYTWLRVSTSQPVTDLVVCDIIDPSKQQVDLSAPSYNFPFYPSGDQATNVTVQYTNRPFASDAERSAATCGTANDTTTDGPWFSDLTAAGGAASVTGVRLILPSYDPGAQGQFIPYFPMRNVETTPGAHVLDWSSFADPAGILRNSAQYVVSNSILGLTKRAVASNGSTTTAAPAGSSLGYELTPTFTSSLPDPQILTIVDDLPNCELTPTVDPGSPWTLTVTRAADYGADGIPCTGDDGAGMQVRFDTSAPVNPNSLPLLRYHVQIASNALNNTVQTNTAVVSSPGNGQPASQRTASTTVNLLGASEIKMIKTADNATAQPGDPVDYRLVWSNTSNTSVGTTRWIDVLPYNGDARGTVISGSLALSAVEILGTPTADVTLEYTAAAPASVNPDPSVAGSTVWCTAAQFGSSGCPADLAAATALRVTVGNLSSGRVGGVHLTLTPTGEQAGDTYRNNVGPGRAANLTAVVPPSQTATVDLVASSIGDLVWWDHNRNGVQDPGEPGIPNVTVHYQGVTSGNVTTDATGHYTVPGLRAGDYRVTVTGGLPPGAAPVYDLDNGTTGANSDSGPFTLALGADRTDVDFGYAANETVTTAISSGSNAAAGAVVHDSVTFTGGLHGTYTPRLLGPVPPNSAGTCAGLDFSSATVVTDPAMAVNADGTLSTPSHALGSIGCYTYAGTFQGPGGISITLVPGDPTETVLVTRRTPTVTTTASTNNAGPGTVINDSVVITGLGAANPATLTWQFIGPVPPTPSGSCAGLIWTGAPVVSQGSAPVSGDGTYGIGQGTVSDQGCYSFADQVSQTGTTNQVTVGAGVPSETVKVSPATPTVVTAASPSTARPGATLTDVITLGNMFGASATVSWQLLGPVASVNGSDCGSVSWTGAPVLASGTVAVVGNGSYPTTGTSVTAAGCYSYTTSLPATGRTTIVDKGAGDPLETVFVSLDSPSVSTTISAVAPLPGETVHDTVVVSGLGAQHTTYTWHLYRAPLPASGSCLDAHWSTSVELVTDSIDITGDGTYLTPNAGITETGCYSYSGSLAATLGSAGVTLVLGHPDETATVVGFAPSITTQASAAAVRSGDGVSDQIVLSGLHGASGTMTWNLLGPVAPHNGSCAGLDWAGADSIATGTIAFQGDGTYHTPTTAVTPIGCYTYTESLPTTSTTQPAATAVGVPAETVQVNPFTPAITTLISATQATAGATVNDGVTITGLGNNATTLAWQLLGPVAPIAKSCATVDWTGAAVLASGTAPITADGQLTTPNRTVSKAGCYTYVEQLASTAVTLAAETQPGDPDETVLVSALPVTPPPVTPPPATPGTPGVGGSGVGGSGSGGSASGGLAWTGASVLLPMVAGLLALSLGALLLIGGRRRRPQDDR